jgi:uncharacterized protein YndB with AHSA1/START domain
MTRKKHVTITLTHRFKVPPERVFDAWLDPTTAGKWLFATPTGTMVKVEIDARVGGAFRFVDRRDGEDVEHVGRYLEIDRPRRLVFTFAVPKFSAHETTVKVDIKQAGSGTELTLTHEGVLPDWADRTEAGWGMLLGQLTDRLGA